MQENWFEIVVLSPGDTVEATKSIQQDAGFVGDLDLHHLAGCLNTEKRLLKRHTEDIKASLLEVAQPAFWKRHSQCLRKGNSGA